MLITRFWLTKSIMHLTIAIQTQKSMLRIKDFFTTRNISDQYWLLLALQFLKLAPISLNFSFWLKDKSMELFLLLKLKLKNLFLISSNKSYQNEQRIKNERRFHLQLYAISLVIKVEDQLLLYLIVILQQHMGSLLEFWSKLNSQDL